MYNIHVSRLSEYLLFKIQEFEKERGKRTSLDKFAEYVGVSRPLISYWLKGTMPSLENVQLLAKKFGSEKIHGTIEYVYPPPFDSAPTSTLPMEVTPVGALLHRQTFVLPFETTLRSK